MPFFSRFEGAWTTSGRALSLGGWLYATAFVPIASPYNASLLYAIANLAVLFALLAVLHRKRIYLTV